LKILLKRSLTIPSFTIEDPREETELDTTTSAQTHQPASLSSHRRNYYGGLSSNGAWRTKLEHYEDNAHHDIFWPKIEPLASFSASGTSQLLLSSSSILHWPSTSTHCHRQ
ncbi:hypothetical protein PanWU01x14_250450, partial [Parasponia andersonii]